MRCLEGLIKAGITVAVKLQLVPPGAAALQAAAYGACCRRLQRVVSAAPPHNQLRCSKHAPAAARKPQRPLSPGPPGRPIPSAIALASFLCFSSLLHTPWPPRPRPFVPSGLPPGFGPFPLGCATMGAADWRLRVSGAHGGRAVSPPPPSRFCPTRAALCPSIGQQARTQRAHAPGAGIQAASVLFAGVCGTLSACPAGPGCAAARGLRAT